MKCGYYWIINPPAARLIDDGSRVPLVDLTVKFGSDEHKAQVFTNENSRPELIKAILTGLSGEKIPEEYQPFLQSIKEHMLTALRLAYDESISVWDRSMWSFSPDERTPSLNIELKVPTRPFQPELISNLFAQSLNYREHFRLYSNGVNEGIPAQYRFLSLYKLLEMEFRRKGKWDKTKLQELIRKFDSRFQQKGIKDPMEQMHSFRDKCAHIRSGRGCDSIGVSELNHKELIGLLRILPIMAEIGADILQEVTGGNVLIRPVDKQEMWDIQARANADSTSRQSR